MKHLKEMKTLTKFCIVCQQDLLVNEFNNRGGKRTGLQSYCKECTKKKHRDWTRNNRGRVNIYHRKRRIFKKEVLVKQSGGKCSDCGGVFHHCVYDFHHLDPKLKNYFPAYAINQLSKVKVQEEIKKCIMLCANCHRIRHYESNN